MDAAYLSSAAKMLTILEALALARTAEPPGLTVTALAQVLDRDKSSVSRQLKPLVESGPVERNESGLHKVGWRLFAIAARAGDQRLLLLAPPVVRRLTQVLREGEHLSVRRGAEVLTILSEGPRSPIDSAGWVGRTVPAACTSSGRALLLDHTPEEIRDMFADGFVRGPGANAPRNVDELIERVAADRERGFVSAMGEWGDDLGAVGAPIRDARWRIVAAVNVSGPACRLGKGLANAGQQVSRAAVYLSRAAAAGF